ncbi:hypothetical protein CANMA_001209 [Candida margitis]|uniref:uncharacterized protein n=1 Tax=Candida margitis TaxID=1775924 RepID=UPI0022271634|nr:uncharacterized protein CANMA_001209 [Candida margitis]KAI5969747.1 hypothetical protein CANMA_001209 [Candida margitis]
MGEISNNKVIIIEDIDVFEQLFDVKIKDYQKFKKFFTKDIDDVAFEIPAEITIVVNKRQVIKDEIKLKEQSTVSSYQPTNPVSTVQQKSKSSRSVQNPYRKAMPQLEKDVKDVKSTHYNGRQSLIPHNEEIFGSPRRGKDEGGIEPVLQSALKSANLTKLRASQAPSAHQITKTIFKMAKCFQSPKPASKPVSKLGKPEQFVAPTDIPAMKEVRKAHIAAPVENPTENLALREVREADPAALTDKPALKEMGEAVSAAPMEMENGVANENPWTKSTYYSKRHSLIPPDEDIFELSKREKDKGGIISVLQSALGSMNLTSKLPSPTQKRARTQTQTQTVTPTPPPVPPLLNRHQEISTPRQQSQEQHPNIDPCTHPIESSIESETKLLTNVTDKITNFFKIKKKSRNSTKEQTPVGGEQEVTKKKNPYEGMIVYPKYNPYSTSITLVGDYRF